jgi:hypothetical protein
MGSACVEGEFLLMGGGIIVVVPITCDRVSLYRRYQREEEEQNKDKEPRHEKSTLGL